MVSFSCPKCPNLMWTSVSTIQMHAKLKHASDEQEGSKFRPIVCGEEAFKVMPVDPPPNLIDLRRPAQVTKDVPPGPVMTTWVPTCNYCGDCFASEDDLVIHMESCRFGEVIGEPNKENLHQFHVGEGFVDALLRIDGRTKRFPCPVPECDIFSTRIDDALEHLNRDHLHRRPFRCLDCNHKAYSPRELREHSKAEHKVDVKIDIKRGKVWKRDVPLPKSQKRTSSLDSSENDDSMPWARKTVLRHDSSNFDQSMPVARKTVLSLATSNGDSSKWRKRQKSDENELSEVIIPVFPTNAKRSILTRTISRYHAMIQTRPQSSGVRDLFRCTYPGCEDRFKDFERVSYHINAQHLKVKPYQCQFCKYKTASAIYSRLHRRTSKRCAQRFKEITGGIPTTFKGEKGEGRSSPEKQEDNESKTKAIVKSKPCPEVDKKYSCPLCSLPASNLLKHMASSHDPQWQKQLQIQVKDFRKTSRQFLTRNGVTFKQDLRCTRSMVSV